MIAAHEIYHGFWYYNWGNVASCVGLGLAFFTLYFARSASQAARETRAEARLGSLLEEIRRGEIHARDLNNHLSSWNLDKASLRADDLLSVLRWIGESSGSVSIEISERDALLKARTVVDGLVKLLQRLEQTAGTPTPREVSKAQGGIRDIYDCFTRLRVSLSTIKEDK